MAKVAKGGQEDAQMQALENLLRCSQWEEWNYRIKCLMLIKYFARFLDGKNVKFSTVSVALLALEAAKR